MKKECPECKGTKQVTIANFGFSTEHRCPKCYGTGYVEENEPPKVGGWFL